MKIIHEQLMFNGKPVTIEHVEFDSPLSALDKAHFATMIRLRREEQNRIDTGKQSRRVGGAK